MLSNTKYLNNKKLVKIVIHELGGVSTVPTFKLMNEKFRLSKSHFIKETLKFLLYKVIGQTLYYRLIYFNKFNFNESKKIVISFGYQTVIQILVKENSLLIL